MSRASKFGILIPAGSDIFAGINVACVISFDLSRLLFGWKSTEDYFGH